MGAFFLIRKDPERNLDRSIAKANQAMCAQGFGAPTRFDLDDHVLCIYGKIVTKGENHIRVNDTDYSCCVGTFLCRGQIGVSALQSLYSDIDKGSLSSTHLRGEYCVVVRKNGRTYIFVDETGVYKTYTDDQQQVFSSSFLVVAAVSGPSPINEQSVYEYVFNGACYAEETIFSNISTLSCDAVYVLDPASTNLKRNEIIAQGELPSPQENYRKGNIRELRNYFQSIAGLFADDIGTALSGGYDSRLILALLLEVNVMPWLYVYGKPSDSDVKIAKMISNQEDFRLCHIDKETATVASTASHDETIDANYHFFDGYPVEGIFDDGTDRATRLHRYKNRSLILNGGGGAIYRNFFNLRDTAFTVKQMLWSFYSRYDPKICASNFHNSDYQEKLSRKIKRTLKVRKDTLTRSEVELVFILFRCRYWMGRNNSINNKVGYSLTPFVDPDIVRQALKIPLNEKNFGDFEGWLIRELNPSLASYMSGYGHSFSQPAPLMTKLREGTNMIRPAWMRRYTYRIKRRLRSGMLMEFAKDDLRYAMRSEGFPYMREFFNTDLVSDTAQFNRMCTLEYLFQRTGARVL